MKEMLVFIDESGDTGLKIGEGSSAYFTLGLVLFEDLAEAEACSKKIGKLREELGLPKHFEFHFHKNRHHIRNAFLKAVAEFNFSYTTVTFDKQTSEMKAPIFQKKESFYLFACDKVFADILPFLENATITLDQIGADDFRVSLRKRLISKNTFNFKAVKKIEQKQSHKINLLQLADYIASMDNKSMKNASADQYFEIIQAKEFKRGRYP